MSSWPGVQFMFSLQALQIALTNTLTPHSTFPVELQWKVLCISSNFGNGKFRGKAERLELSAQVSKVRISETVIAIWFKIFQLTCNLHPPLPLFLFLFWCVVCFPLPSSMSQYNTVKMSGLLWEAKQSDLYVKNWRNNHMFSVCHQLCWVRIKVLTEKWEKLRLASVPVYRKWLWFNLMFPSF